jgi:nucleoside-diphosphate-sugar epimerase
MSHTVLVTGGSGFIGGWCVAELLNRGYQVRATVRSLSKEAAARAAVTRVADPEDRLTFFPALLTSDEGWDEAAAGCDYVLHVASPLGVDNPKSPAALIEPARDGALRALRAAVKAGVKRVVMTSSVAATSPPNDQTDAVADEQVWTNPDDPKIGAYAQSKTLAERAAWAFMREAGPATSLSVVNPALVLGPVLSPDGLGSVQVVQRLLNGSMPGYPRLGFNIVDVRDVADLHIRAMTAPEAAGERFIAAGEFLWMKQMAEILRAELPKAAARAPTRPIPDMVLRLFSVFDPALRSVTPGLGRKHAFSSQKAQTLLHWTPRPVTGTLTACAQSLQSMGAL